MKAARQEITTGRGFTLLEILVVMVIAALMVALVPPLFSGAVSGTRLKGSVRDLAVALRETRSQAIIHNTERRVQLDLKTPRYRVGNNKPSSLPKDAKMAVQTITGASGFTAASPVTIPTLSAPSSAAISKNFSLTSALIGAV